MPLIGEIRKAAEVEKKGTGRYIWLVCIDCGKERWVHCKNTQPRSLRCKSCAGRLRRQPRGEKSKIWKGGRFKTGDDYIMIRVYPSDFFYPMASSTGHILEHRLVMAKKLGRCLQSWEIVHHLNGIRDDNRAENLTLTMKQYHQRHTIEVVLKEHVKVLENKIDKILEGQKELKQEIRLLRLENRTLKERSTL